MWNMVKYTEGVEVLLGEAGKYLALLLFAVLAIRLWREWSRASAGNKMKYLPLACLASAAAGIIGYFSICHSLSRLYYYYGLKAFDAGNLSSAASLFETSAADWKNADAIGGAGICLLLTDQPDKAMPQLAEAKSLRGGRNSFFEEFYEGTYLFFHGQTDQAIPLLEDASTSEVYEWSVTRLLSVIALEKNRPEDARRLMKPFSQVEIVAGDCAHSYVVAALKLQDGKKAEAKTILDQFPADKLSPFWNPRFDKLRAKLAN
jgi:hypothetical protein